VGWWMTGLLWVAPCLWWGFSLVGWLCG
jgi:hypothetical protein